MIVMGKFANSLDVSCSSAKSIEYLQDSSSFLHRDNSELILFINPDQEGLIIVMEDTSSRWPVSVQVTGFQESISFLEKEMIGNKLVLIFCRHTLKWIELTLKVSFKCLTGLDNFVHDLESLFLWNTRSKRVSGKVSPNSNSGRSDHRGILFAEFSIHNSFRRHVWFMLVWFFVAVIIHDDLVKELIELCVGLVGSSINSNTWVKIGNSRENAGLESNLFIAGHIFVLLPNLLGQALGKLRFSSWREKCFEVLKLMSFFINVLCYVDSRWNLILRLSFFLTSKFWNHCISNFS